MSIPRPRQMAVRSISHKMRRRRLPTKINQLLHEKIPNPYLRTVGLNKRKRLSTRTTTTPTNPPTPTKGATLRSQTPRINTTAKIITTTRQRNQATTTTRITTTRRSPRPRSKTRERISLKTSKRRYKLTSPHPKNGKHSKSQPSCKWNTSSPWTSSSRMFIYVSRWM